MDLGQHVYELKRKFQSEGIAGLAVDIDDTLSQTSRKFHETLNEMFPAPAHVTVEAARKQYALTGKVLHWQEIPEALKYAKSFVDDPEFHSYLEKIEEAEAGMQKLHQRRLVRCYHTARLELMRDITERWLQGNFPDLPLIMRPEHINHAGQAQWKAEVIKYLYPEIQGIVDNDARIARILEQCGYEGKVFLVGTDEQSYQPNKTIIPVESWSDLTKIILQTFAEQQSI